MTSSMATSRGSQAQKFEDPGPERVFSCLSAWICVSEGCCDGLLFHPRTSLTNGPTGATAAAFCGYLSTLSRDSLMQVMSIVSSCRTYNTSAVWSKQAWYNIDVIRRLYNDESLHDSLLFCLLHNMRSILVFPEVACVVVCFSRMTMFASSRVVCHRSLQSSMAAFFLAPISSRYRIQILDQPEDHASIVPISRKTAPFIRLCTSRGRPHLILTFAVHAMLHSMTDIWTLLDAACL